MPLFKYSMREHLKTNIFGYIQKYSIHICKKNFNYIFFIYFKALSKTCVITFISIFFTLEKLRFKKFKHKYRAFIWVV